MSVDSLKALANRRGAALRKQNEELESLKTALAVEREAKERALERAETLAGELDALRLQVRLPDADDDQPSEQQEWLDFDRDC